MIQKKSHGNIQMNVAIKTVAINVSVGSIIQGRIYGTCRGDQSWASPDHFMAALKNPELHRTLETAMDHSPNYPGLYEGIGS